MRRPQLTALALALVAACGPQAPGPGEAADAGSAADAGAPPGEGTAADAGTLSGDGGVLPDGGSGKDAGAPDCGDGTCAAPESCSSCPEDCGSCCSHAGGLSCGGNGIAGDAGILYRCNGTRYVPLEDCNGACVVLPAGTPDRCPQGAPPASLVTKLSDKPYVEGSCTPATWAGWPYEAKRCTYSASGLTATVTVANPSPELVAKWIVDASAFIPRLRALRSPSPAEWEQGLAAVAQAMLLQSSRIFPLEGGIIEDMSGTGGVNYPFLDGVTQGCSSGCYCRINSLHRTTYCAFRGATSSETEAACLSRVGSSGHARWSTQCLANHVQAWTQDWNEHFRAAAWDANKAVASQCPTATSCTPSQVVSAVRAAYGL